MSHDGAGLFHSPEMSHFVSESPLRENPDLQLNVQIELNRFPAEHDKYPLAGGTRTKHVTCKQYGCEPLHAWSASHTRFSDPTKL